MTLNKHRLVRNFEEMYYSLGGSSETLASQQLVTSKNKRWEDFSVINISYLTSSLHYQHPKVEGFALAEGSTLGSCSILGKPLCYHASDPGLISCDVKPKDLQVLSCC